MRVAALVLLVPLAAASCAVSPPGPPPIAAAVVPNQVWVGRLRCDIIPQEMTRTLNQEVRIEVRDGVAHMGRDVLMPDVGTRSGFHESVSGRVGPRGGVTLTGEGFSRNAGYSAEYRGRLPQEGGPAEFTGVQRWHFARLPPFDRACSIALHRIG